MEINEEDMFWIAWFLLLGVFTSIMKGILFGIFIILVFTPIMYYRIRKKLFT